MTQIGALGAREWDVRDQMGEKNATKGDSITKKKN